MGLQSLGSLWQGKVGMSRKIILELNLISRTFCVLSIDFLTQKGVIFQVRMSQELKFIELRLEAN